MPLDGTIPAGVAPPSPGQNPFGMISAMADTQNKINQMRLFQQTFAARQRMGQILATAPDSESGWDAIMKDPQVAPFAGDALNSWRSAQLALTQQQGEQQKQAMDGYHAFMQLMPAVAADPSMASGALNSTLKMLSPTAAARVEPAVKDLWASMTDGLDPDPKIAQGQFAKRAAALVLSGGFGPDVNKALYGTPNLTDLGGVMQPTLTLPPQLGGSTVPVGAALPKTLAPTPVTGPYGPGGAQQTTVIGGAGTPGIAPSAPPAPPANALVGSGPGEDVAGNALVPNVPALRGPSMEDQGSMEGRGKAAGDIASEMSDRAKELPVSMQRVDMLTNALRGFQAGGGADIRAGVGKFAQALKNVGLPISQATIDGIANGSLAAGQTFDANIKPMVISELKAAAQGTGRVMRSEVDAFLAMMDKTTDPKALLGLMNQARQTLAIGYDQSQKYVEFNQALRAGDPVAQKFGPSGFYQWYDKNYSAKDLPKTNASGGIQLGPTPAKDIKGAAPERKLPPGWKYLGATPQ